MIDISQYARKVFSQRGEDGIIECVLDQLGIQQGWCCEFGAWDGIHLSNVYKLITEGWRALLIEGDKQKYVELLDNMKDFPKVFCHNDYISPEVGKNLDFLLTKYEIPHLNVLSIDIDSYDYWVWATLETCPDLVVIEYNSNWEEAVTIPFNPEHKEWTGNSFFGASALALKQLAEIKQYDLIGFVAYTNLFFLRQELNQGRFKLFDLALGSHIQRPHHAPLTQEQACQLVYL